MTYKFLRNSLVIAAAALSAAAIVPQQAAAQSRAYCDQYARDYANRNTRTGNNVVGGAVGGAIVGGVIGSVTGSWGRGAAIGSGVGAATGLGKSSVDWDRNYRYAYNECIRGRVRVKQAPARGRYEPWSPEWYDYCSAKYRSFNPKTGYFTTYGGEQRFCR